VLDESGVIIAVNEAWRAFAREAGYVGADHGIGVNYLAVCEAGAAVSQDAARAAAGLGDIIAGRRQSFRMEYPCVGPGGPRWFQLRVTRPAGARSRRIVIAHEDITDVKRAEESLARLNARILQLQDEERRRIARELHDTTAQNLLAISLNAARLRLARGEEGRQGSRIAVDILELAERSLQEIRTLSYLLHPPLLDEIGLESALRWLARGFGERSGIAIDTRIEPLDCQLSIDQATALFRVAQESLSNVHRHSGSIWARVSVRSCGKTVVLAVEDRGRGLPHPGPEVGGVQEMGVGVSGMRVRLEQLGGRLELLPLPAGLLVRATLPVTAGPAVETTRAEVGGESPVDPPSAESP
jgi:signal transduction histidine kinase